MNESYEEEVTSHRKDVQEFSDKWGKYMTEAITSLRSFNDQQISSCK
jgi:hypothetical protein